MDNSTPRFYHITGLNVWAHCDHDSTDIDISTETVRLSFENVVTASDKDNVNILNEWLKVKGGAKFHYFSEDQCASGTGLLISRSGQVYAIDENNKWASLSEK